MGRAGVGHVLVPGPDAHPDAERDRPDRGQVLGNDPKAAGKDSATDTWDWFGSHLLVVPAGTVPGPALPVPVAIAAPVAAAVTVTAVAGPVPGTAGLPRALRRESPPDRSSPAASRSTTSTGTSDSLPRSSTSRISTWILSPMCTTSSMFSIRLPPCSLRIWVMCSRPSLPGSSDTNAPNVGGLHDRAEEPLADLGHVRVGDRVDRGPRRLGRRAVGGPDVDRAVVLDRDLRRRSRRWIELIILPFGPMTSPILSTGTLMVVTRGRVRAHLVGLVDRLGA